MTALRARVLDAAIELLGTQGLKDLTHRRIDEKAGLPPRSTSNSYRTRDGLLRGAAEAMHNLAMNPHPLPAPSLCPGPGCEVSPHPSPSAHSDCRCLLEECLHDGDRALG